MSQKILAVFGATGAQGGGLAWALAADPSSGFVARAAHKPETLGAALAGAYGAFVVTNCWEPISAEREGVQASNIARAICCTVHCCDVPFDTYRGLGFPGAAGLRWLARGERLGG